MSRAYWVKLSSSVSETVDASDKAIHRIDLDAVVPEGEMAELVEDALSDSEWEKQDDGTFKKTMDDGVTLTWDMESMTVEAEVEAERELVQEIEVSGRGYEESAARKEAERLLHEREKAARDAMGVERERLQRKLAEKLGGNEKDRVKEINDVLRKTYAEAIKRKAERLGNVTSIQESTSPEGDYQLTITVAE